MCHVRVTSGWLLGNRLRLLLTSLSVCVRDGWGIWCSDEALSLFGQDEERDGVGEKLREIERKIARSQVVWCKTRRRLAGKGSGQASFLLQCRSPERDFAPVIRMWSERARKIAGWRRYEDWR